VSKLHLLVPLVLVALTGCPDGDPPAVTAEDTPFAFADVDAAETVSAPDAGPDAIPDAPAGDLDVAPDGLPPEDTAVDTDPDVPQADLPPEVDVVVVDTPVADALEDTSTEDAPDLDIPSAGDGQATDSSADASDADGGAPGDAAAEAESGPADVASNTVCDPVTSTFVDAFGQTVVCLFVAPDGAPQTGDGSPATPYASIAKALEVAAGQPGDTIYAIAVSKGTYPERVVLQSGISIYGQFDRADGWSRSPDNVTIVSSTLVVDGRIEALVAVGIQQPTFVDGLSVSAGPAAPTDFGVDVYGVRVVDSTAEAPATTGLVLTNVTVAAGAGGPGAEGVAGADGAPGEIGGTGTAGTKDNGNPVPGANGSVSVCDGVTVETTRGGQGGQGGGDGAQGCGTYQESQEAGAAPQGLASCAGGTAGDSCSCVSPIDYNGEDGGPGNLCDPTSAAAGLAASSPTTHGDASSGLWSPTVPAGGETGQPGVGGSGGGGGGSGCDAGGWGTTGGGGGGGGSGGCGGHGGEAGGPGGSSFGLFVVNSVIDAESSTFTSSDGGVGGAGGPGGPGGTGGSGGDGGTGGYSGGMGGQGQTGGDGGAGAGGVGGSSIAALVCSGAVSNLDVSGLTAGLAGAAGPAAASGNIGVAGLATTFFSNCSF